MGRNHSLLSPSFMSLSLMNMHAINSSGPHTLSSLHACLLQSWPLTKQTSSEMSINTRTVSLIRESIFSPHATQKWSKTEKENTELTADLCLCLLRAEMSQENLLHRGMQKAPPGFLNLGFKIRKELLSSESVSWERSDALSTPGRLWCSQSAVYQSWY